MEVSKFVMLRKNFLMKIQLEILYILRISKYLELNGLLEFRKKMINFLESICFAKKKKSKMKLSLDFLNQYFIKTNFIAKRTSKFQLRYN